MTHNQQQPQQPRLPRKRSAVYRSGGSPGQTTSYHYDGLDRLIEIDYADGQSVKNIYDADGNLTKQVDSVAGTSSYTYDQKNRLTAETLASGQTHNYTYDPANNLLTSSDASGITTYGYDAANENTSVLDPGASTPTQLAYDNDGRAVCTSLPNGVIIQTAPLAGGETKSITVLKPGNNCQTTPTTQNTLLSHAYSYINPATPHTDTQLRYSDTDQAGNTATYSYDALNRLTKAQGPAHTYTYTLDPTGNILTKTDNSTTTTFAYNTANELCWVYVGTSTNTCANPPSSAITYAFDKDGNETGNSNGLAFSYNARNQTTGITPPGQAAQPFSYIGGGQSLLSAFGTTSCPGQNTTLDNNLLGINASTQNTIIAGGSGCSTPTTTSSTTNYSRTVQGGLLDQRTSSATLYPLEDGLGSIIGETNSAGSLADTTTYDPYGAITSSTGSDTSIFGFDGGLNTTAGLVKFGQRYYDPSIMRWTQQDSLNQVGDATQDDRYGYAGGDPQNEIDLSGAETGYVTLCPGGCSQGKSAFGHFVSSHLKRLVETGLDVAYQALTAYGTADYCIETGGLGCGAAFTFGAAADRFIRKRAFPDSYLR